MKETDATLKECIQGNPIVLRFRRAFSKKSYNSLRSETKANQNSMGITLDQKKILYAL